jgi:hypothetical protein
VRSYVRLGFLHRLDGSALSLHCEHTLTEHHASAHVAAAFVDSLSRIHLESLDSSGSLHRLGIVGVNASSSLSESSVDSLLEIASDRSNTLGDTSLLLLLLGKTDLAQHAQNIASRL